ncbi:MAG: hypothetical protein II473_02935 [Clostridia bacterium]|nr:hypothetical protein [Clostridia bacterium]MBQ1896122.1 hypothetical protein [Clostridia bacterium]MBQ2092127.1 hypothetical protein [Clostridia bacterium]MBQ3897459.1 hypothetical protein [Clostridia bacterium]MBQ6752144.1 hypothetical protein [Clostridia bacterium]
MLEKIKKVIKLALKFVLVAVLGFVGYLVWVINPFNMPAIFKRNYPEAFERFPLKLISPFISIW